MKAIKKYLFIILICALQFACKKELQLNEFKQYLQDSENGLVKNKEMSGLSFELSYLPDELVNEENTENKGAKDINAVKYQYFVFKIKDGSNRSPLKSKAVDKEDLFNKLYYVQTKLKNDFVLRCGTESVNCIFLNYEDDHNLSNEMKVLVAFETPKGTSDWVIEYDDNIFGLGPLNFKIKQKDLQDLPELKI